MLAESSLFAGTRAKFQISRPGVLRPKWYALAERTEIFEVACSFDANTMCTGLRSVVRCWAERMPARCNVDVVYFLWHTLEYQDPVIVCRCVSRKCNLRSETNLLLSTYSSRSRLRLRNTTSAFLTPAALFPAEGPIIRVLWCATRTRS